MSAQSLFNIVLKVLGIYFVKDIIISIPALLSVTYNFGSGDISGAVSTLLITSLTLLVYCIVAYYLVFKSEWMIVKFRLLENVPEDPIPFKVHSSTVISISVLVVALYLIAQAIPLLLRELMRWYQYNKVTNGFFGAMESYDHSMLIVYAAEIIIGLLLIGQLRQVVSYIELKGRKRARQ